jgi:hypothetical protein
MITNVTQVNNLSVIIFDGNISKLELPENPTDFSVCFRENVDMDLLYTAANLQRTQTPESEMPTESHT